MRSLSDLKYTDHFSDFIKNFVRTSYLCYLVWCIFPVLYIPPCHGQVNKSVAADILYSYFNTLYKLDQNLINGIKYYKPQESVLGNEFFLDEKSSRGKITVNGKEYPNVFLKYDLVNQQIILEYDFSHGGMMQIILDNEKISEFEIFDKTFRKYYFPSVGEKFFQTIDADNLGCLIYWKKERISTGSSLQYAYRYSEEKKKTYLLMDNQLYQYGGKKSFINLFPDIKDEIKKFIKRNNLEIRNISETNLIKLLEYCYDLIQDAPKDTNR